MELEKIKEIWKSVDDSPLRTISSYEMNAITRKKSFSLIAQMKRNLLWELVAVIFLYSAGGVYFFITGFDSIALLLALLFTCFLFYYYMKNRLLMKMNCISCEVKSNMERQLKCLQRYQQFYSRATAILTPLSFIAVWFILSDVHGLRFPLSGSDSTFFVLFLILGIAVSGTTYLLNKIYVQKLYGRHISRLKSLLKEINEVE